MIKVIKMRYRLAALLVLGMVLAAATYGFAAANTVPDTTAGEGSGVISGYEVVDVAYVLDSADPTNFDSVSFDLQAAASDVYAGLGDGGGSIYWTGCTSSGGTVWTCDLSASTVSVRDATSLHVSSTD